MQSDICAPEAGPGHLGRKGHCHYGMQRGVAAGQAGLGLMWPMGFVLNMSGLDIAIRENIQWSIM